MNRISPSWALMLLALVLCLHFACSTTTPSQLPPAPPGMVLIPGGTFMMGCTKGDVECANDEKEPRQIYDEMPLHHVAVRAFFMDKTETTVEDYQLCVEEGNCTPAKSKDDNNDCNVGYAPRSNHPINCIDWYQARVYCKVNGKRLPSEAEWEYAARGGHQDWKHPWGNEKPNCSRVVMADGNGGHGCGKESTWPVGSMPSNGYGLYDMAGNVWEWTEDCFHEDVWDKVSSDWKEIPIDGKAWTTSCSLRDGSVRRIIRGGSWNYGQWDLRVSWRAMDPPESWYPHTGFRCVIPLFPTYDDATESEIDQIDAERENASDKLRASNEDYAATYNNYHDDLDFIYDGSLRRTVTVHVEESVYSISALKLGDNIKKHRLPKVLFIDKHGGENASDWLYDHYYKGLVIYTMGDEILSFYSCDKRYALNNGISVGMDVKTVLKLLGAEKETQISPDMDKYVLDVEHPFSPSRVLYMVISSGIVKCIYVRQAAG